MSDTKRDALTCFLLTAGAGMVFWAGAVLGRAEVRQEAMDAGVAAYVMPDASTGETEFRFIQCERDK